jgi:AraC-like DNA-binding protein
MLKRPYLLSKKYTVKGFHYSAFEELPLPTAQGIRIDDDISDTCNTWINDHNTYLSPVMKILIIQRAVLEKPSLYSNLAQLAKLVDASIPWVSTKFKEISDIKLKIFIIKSKCGLALYNILSTRDPIKTISRNIGYHPNSFAKVFFSVFGLHPVMIRKNIYNYLISCRAMPKRVSRNSIIERDVRASDDRTNSRIIRHDTESRLRR